MHKISKKEEIQLMKDAEEARIETNRKEEYLPILMTALEEATIRANFDLTVKDGQFTLRDRNGAMYPDIVVLSPNYSRRDWEELERLNLELEYRAEARAEQERIRLAKEVALAKLTQEEKLILGLK